MVPIYKEASFPLDYRQATVWQIMGAVYKLRSIAITGLAGMGKSNVVRFIVSHPQVRAHYLCERADDFAFVHVDCAGLAESNEAEILGEVVAQMHHDQFATGVSHLPPPCQNIRRVLKEQVLSLEPELNLVLVLDYFDEAGTNLNKSFFNYLFHLRNTRPRGNLCYIFATRRPMGHLFELHELLDDGCMIGPLSGTDALASIQRDEARLGCPLDAEQRNNLIACTGRHPGLLKNAVELAGSGHVDVRQPVKAITRQLLESDKIKNLCEELWNDLTATEQGVLLKAARGLPLPDDEQGSADISFLVHSGLLLTKEGEQNRAIFGPLLETFVRAKAAASGPARLAAVFPNLALIETAAGAKQLTLSPRLFALLLALSEAPRQVLSSDELIARVYGDEAPGVTNAALSQLVKRLRGVLDPNAQQLTGDATYTTVETVRDVGYRLNG